MRKILLIAVGVLAFGEIDKYLDAVKKIPDTKIEKLKIEEMKINKKSVVYTLYPKLNLFANAVYYSTPTSLRPLPPTEVNKIALSGGGYPFSKQIEKIGFEISMPLFVKEILDNKKKMEYLLKSTKEKVKLNLLEKEALLIAKISNYNYLLDLKTALLKKRNSIKETLKAIEVGVKVGRIAQFNLERLKDALLNIDVNLKKIDNSINSLKADIFKLTNLEVDKKIDFTGYLPSKKEYLALKQIKNLILSSKYALSAAKDKSIPKVFFKANGYRAFGKAYDNKEDLALNFASAGVYVSWDIFNKTNNASKEKAKVEYMKNTLLFQKTLKDLKAKEKELLENLKNVNKAILISKKSISIKKELLKSAKVAFNLKEMKVDEYLRYEDDLANAKANLANLIALKNQIIANLAFIYGENFKKVFK